MTEAMTLPEALDMIEYLKAAMNEMSGSDTKNLPGFSRSESLIIRTLVSANGRIVTRLGLMAALYQCSPNEPDIKILDAWFFRIRRKMRRMFPGDPDRIRCEYDVGYYWSGPSLEPEGGHA